MILEQNLGVKMLHMMKMKEKTTLIFLPGTYESRGSLKSVQKKHKNKIKAYKFWTLK